MKNKIEGINSFVRDSRNKAIVNVDNGALEAYKKQRKIIASAKSLSEEVELLKSDINEIKSLIHQLINKK